ncbi:hypothetical protein MHBO_002538 [Bonamia ostreae]
MKKRLKTTLEKWTDEYFLKLKDDFGLVKSPEKIFAKICENGVTYKECEDNISISGIYLKSFLESENCKIENSEQFLDQILANLAGNGEKLSDKTIFILCVHKIAENYSNLPKIINFEHFKDLKSDFDFNLINKKLQKNCVFVDEKTKVVKCALDLVDFLFSLSEQNRKSDGASDFVNAVVALSRKLLGKNGLNKLENGVLAVLVDFLTVAIKKYDQIAVAIQREENKFLEAVQKHLIKATDKSLKNNENTKKLTNFLIKMSDFLPLRTSQFEKGIPILVLNIIVNETMSDDVSEILSEYFSHFLVESPFIDFGIDNGKTRYNSKEKTIENWRMFQKTIFDIFSDFLSKGILDKIIEGQLFSKIWNKNFVTPFLIWSEEDSQTLKNRIFVGTDNIRFNKF